MFAQLEWKMLNEQKNFLKTPRDKLINHTSHKYGRNIIYLVPLINNRYQQGH